MDYFVTQDFRLCKQKPFRMLRETFGCMVNHTHTHNLMNKFIHCSMQTCCRSLPLTTMGPMVVWTTSWGSPTTNQSSLQSGAGLLSVCWWASTLKIIWDAPVLPWWVLLHLYCRVQSHWTGEDNYVEQRRKDSASFTKVLFLLLKLVCKNWKREIMKTHDFILLL